MKTSNKLLLITFGLLVGVTIAAMVYIRFFKLKNVDSLVGNQEMVEDPRNVSDFHTLDIRDNIKVVLRNGDKSVVVKGESNLVENVVTESQNNTLKTYQKKGFRIKSNQPIIVLIQSPELKEIKLSQAARATCADTLVGQELKLEFSGAAQAEILSAYSQYDVTMSGAASAQLIGHGDALNINLSGGSKLNALHLICSDINIEGSGASSASLHAQNSLNAELSGACNVRYRGDAKDVRSRLSGASIMDKE